jgi:two-component system chemotaxis response regulator CheB
MQYYPLPVIIISSLGQASCQVALDALRIGAVEVLAKPGGPYSVGELRANLACKIRAAAAARITGTRHQQQASTAARTVPSQTAYISPASTFDPHLVIAIGASTGGTEALKEVLMHLPANVPGILITQHIPPVFSRALAARLNEICPIEVKEAVDGDVLAPGRALLAPGNFHMLLRKASDGYRVQVKDGPQVCYQRPSVDVMFSSVADIAGNHTIAAILTGMGADGAQGMLKLKRAGAGTIAQDEASCVVFGMPREAIRVGAVDRIVPLSQIAPSIIAEATARSKHQLEQQHVR